MSARSSSVQIRPMQTAGTQHFIERTYRESSQFQWVRELFVNALEADATRVEFGIEWQAVENKRVYRRMVADNGCGMTALQLVEFFNTFGGGGKPIGGAHENFGVGSKTSLLPWNKYGMVVISWVDGDPSMIWVKCDPESGEYGLKLELCDSPAGESLEEVYYPYDDPQHGCDWSSVKPDWIEDHGTVVILLGNMPTADTVKGDPGRDEADIKGISSFLNRRMWEIPPNVDVYVDELRTADHTFWPPDVEAAHGPPTANGGDRRTNTRRIEGAKHYIEYSSPRFKDGKLGADGIIDLKDGTEIHWYLWEGERPKIQSYAAISGYIAALYKGELYDISAHHSTYRSFGVSESSVRSRLWLIIKPIVDEEGKRGVYPRTDRSSLLIKGGPSAGGPLPINDWAAEFADNMPDEIVDALKAARPGSLGEITDNQWREKLAEKFGSRWRVPRLRLKLGGSVLLSESPDGIPLLPAVLRRGKKSENDGGGGGGGGSNGGDAHATLRRAKLGGHLEGEWTRAPGGLPRYRPVGAKDVGKGMLAAWQPNDPEFPEGVVLLNVEHPVILQVIEHWQAQYADHHSESIAKDIIDVYGQVAVSKVAHSEHLKCLVSSHIVEKNLRSEEALTMALLGLMSEDHLISTRIGGKYSKKRYAVADQRRIRPTPSQ